MLLLPEELDAGRGAEREGRDAAPGNGLFFLVERLVVAENHLVDRAAPSQPVAAAAVARPHLGVRNHILIDGRRNRGAGLLPLAGHVQGRVACIVVQVRMVGGDGHGELLGPLRGHRGVFIGREGELVQRLTRLRHDRRLRGEPVAAVAPDGGARIGGARIQRVVIEILGHLDGQFTTAALDQLARAFVRFEIAGLERNLGTECHTDLLQAIERVVEFGEKALVDVRVAAIDQVVRQAPGAERNPGAR